MLQVIGVYWWYRNDDLLYPLIMVPPKAVPPFWHAIFVILVNGMSLDPSFSYLLTVIGCGFTNSWYWLLSPATFM